MGWGHLPRFLIEDELRKGRLLSIAGRHFPGVSEELVVARRADRPHGPTANRLWQFLRENAPSLRARIDGKNSRRSAGSPPATKPRRPG